MPSNWSKGLTKETHPSIQKRSSTMVSRKIDNFANWRNRMRLLGIIPTNFSPLIRNGDLAELIGVILGDGHIRKFPRTEELSIFSNSNNPGFIQRYSNLIYKVFNKKPALTRHSGENCTRIRIYQKNIQKRLKIPYSPRGKLKIVVPEWIFKEKRYILRYLRGLYEAEGSLNFHKGTYTHKFIFTNINISMLDNVYKLVKKIGFNPHRSLNKVQVSRKDDVKELVKMIGFRKY
jgi:DNA-binding transcriptional regulator WhiA